jgi:hypothetical protein
MLKICAYFSALYRGGEEPQESPRLLQHSKLKKRKIGFILLYSKLAPDYNSHFSPFLFLEIAEA